MDFSLFGLLSWYLVFLFSLVAHEAAHACAAWKLGDPTAHQGGQVTLDPYPHIKREPIGTVVLPLLVYIHSGWMIGWASAPFDPVWASKYPRRHALMAMAGPAANFCIVVAALLIMKIGIYCGVFTSPIYPDAEHLVVSASANWLYVAARFLSIAFYLNMILFLFNLFPVPPLDGFSVLKGVLPDALMDIHKEIGMNPILRWGGIIVAWALFPTIGRPLLQFAERLIDI
jgi:Zn-dependent protease